MIIKPIALYFTLIEKERKRNETNTLCCCCAIGLHEGSWHQRNSEFDQSEGVFDLTNHIIAIRSYDFVYPTYSVVSGGKKDIDES